MFNSSSIRYLCTNCRMHCALFTRFHLHSVSHLQPFIFSFCIRERRVRREGEKEGSPLIALSNLTGILVTVFYAPILVSGSSSFYPPSPPLLIFVLPPPIWDALVPQFEEAVPGACAHTHAIIRDAGAAHPVVVARQHTWGRRGKKRGKKKGDC